MPLLLVLVGCWGDEPGLHLEVRVGSTGAKRVELYLATRPCEGCQDLLKPQGVRTKLPGKVWLLDGDMMTRTPNTVVDVTGGKVVFDVLPPAAKDIDVAYIVAVGYADDGTVVGVSKLDGVTVPHGRGKYWRITLDDAVDQASGTELEPHGNRVWVWRRSDPTTSQLSACVGLEESDGRSIVRTWFVPEDDTDCDGIDLECDRYNFQAMGTADFASASCVTSTIPQPGLPSGTCLLGGPACIDGNADKLSCGPVLPYYCGPSPACSAPLCRQDLPACVMNGLISYLKIDFPMSTSMERCTSNPQQYAVVIDLSAMVPTKPGVTPATCTDVKFAKLAVNTVVLQDDFFSGGATFKVGAYAAPCKFLMTFFSGASATINHFTFMDLVLSNGTHELLPVRVEMRQGDCTNLAGAAHVLHLAPGDLITSCALVPKGP